MLFITGFPGFIGKRLVQALLDEDPSARVVCLVEPRMEQAARAAASGLDRVEILPGDITERRLGLGSDDYERLTAEIIAVFHLAAVYDLAVPLEIAHKVNVEGTGNIVELCRDCQKLERLNYVSTAYVAGARKNVVYEHELVMGQRFKNHYESTKFQAEVWVRESMDEVPTSIYRPAIVVGDSQSGETQKFDGPYYMLRSIAFSQKRRLPIAKYGRSAAPFNVVPVDFVVNGIVAGSQDQAAAGKTFHLVDPEPISASEVFTLLSEIYASRKPLYTLPAGPVALALRVKPVRQLFQGIPSESIQYLNHDVRYDARHATELLEHNGLRLPRFREYAETMVRFFRDHEADPAFAPAL